MSATDALCDRHFYRDADRAVLGGVCAGLADYLGFNLKTTRILAVIACIMVTPLAVLSYLLVVFFVPAVSRVDDPAAFTRPARISRRSRCWSRRGKHARTEARSATPRPNVSTIIDRKCNALEARLAILERRITSRRFQLDQEFAKL
jgi:phage shock protein C